MSERRSIICLEITELLQKSRYLDYDSKDVLICWVIMHAEALDCLIVFDDRVKSLLF
jgi:hypothetical protein